MNKRQKKKRNKIAMDRVRYFNRYHRLIFAGRQNGKTYKLNQMMKAIYSKKHKPFNDIKKTVIR